MCTYPNQHFILNKWQTLPQIWGNQTLANPKPFFNADTPLSLVTDIQSYYHTCRKRQRSKVPFLNETSDERASIATRMSMRGYDDFGAGTGYPTKPQPFRDTLTPRMTLPVQAQQMYENPTYTHDGGKNSFFN